MNEERLFNKTVITFLNDLRGIPQTVGEVHQYVSSRIRRPCEAQVQRAFDYLESAGYVERCEATAADVPMFKITAEGIRQATKMVSAAQLDRSIWD